MLLSKKNLCLLLIIAALFFTGCSRKKDKDNYLPVHIDHAKLDGKIGTRVIEGDGEFYNMSTGGRVEMRGHNYVILGWQLKRPGEYTFTHSNFNVGDPANAAIYEYEPAKAEADLARLEELGYNTVRVFLTSGQISDPDCSSGVSSAYVANLVDFLEKCRDHKIRMFLTFSMWMPANYAAAYWGNESGLYSGVTGFYLAQSQIDARNDYMIDFMNEMVAQGAPMDWIISYSVINEIQMKRDDLPLSLTNGSITTPTGTYNLGDNAAKELMMQNGMTHFISETRAAIRSVDGDALVTVGLVPYLWLKDHATKWIVPLVVPLQEGGADYMDVHPYLHQTIYTDDPAGHFGERVPDFGFTSDMTLPRVIGEFGTYKPVYPDLTNASILGRDYQIASTDYGFDGWLWWRYEEIVQAGAAENYWDALDGGEAINEILAPANRPDPSQP
ncbi:MAG: hypothetical protein ACYS8W_17720 [Planctomycetota bacterium]|jgi:endo-1,4-beta-mannosidase